MLDLDIQPQYCNLTPDNHDTRSVRYPMSKQPGTMAVEISYDNNDQNTASATGHDVLPPKEATTTSNKAMTPMDVQEQILHELRQLNRLQAELAAEPPLKTQAVWNFVFQLFGLVVGTLFGVFAVLAWKSSNEANTIAARAIDLSTAANSIAVNANDLAKAANKLAFAGFCESATTGICSTVWAAATSSVSIYASDLYGITPTTSRTASSGSTTNSDSQATATSTPGGPRPSTSGGRSKSGIIGGIVGGILGVLVVLMAAYVQIVSYRRKQERSHEIQQHYGY